MKDNTILVTSAQLCYLLNTNSGEIRNWRTLRGCPPYESKSRYDLKKILEWWLENIYSEQVSDGDIDTVEAKRRYWIAKTANEEIKAQKGRDESILRATAETALSTRAARLGQILSEEAAVRIAHRIVGVSGDEVVAILRDEHLAALDEYARGPLVTD